MESKTHRRAKVTAETMAESVKLRELWDADANKPTQAVFGEKFEIGTQPAVGFFLSGQTPLSLKAARGFAKGLNCAIADFSPRLADLAEGIAVSSGVLRLKARPSAWPFSDEVLRRLGGVEAVQLRKCENLVRLELGLPVLDTDSGNSESAQQ